MGYLGLNREGAPALIVDVLESWDGEWFSLERLTAVMEDVHPREYSPATIQRAVHRLVDAGKIEHRAVQRTWPPRRNVLEVRRPYRGYLLQIA